MKLHKENKRKKNNISNCNSNISEIFKSNIWKSVQFQKIYKINSIKYNINRLNCLNLKNNSKNKEVKIKQGIDNDKSKTKEMPLLDKTYKINEILSFSQINIKNKDNKNNKEILLPSLSNEEFISPKKLNTRNLDGFNQPNRDYEMKGKNSYTKARRGKLKFQLNLVKNEENTESSLISNIDNIMSNCYDVKKLDARYLLKIKKNNIPLSPIIKNKLNNLQNNSEKNLNCKEQINNNDFGAQTTFTRKFSNREFNSNLEADKSSKKLQNNLLKISLNDLTKPYPFIITPEIESKDYIKHQLSNMKKINLKKLEKKFNNYAFSFSNINKEEIINLNDKSKNENTNLDNPKDNDKSNFKLTDLITKKSNYRTIKIISAKNNEIDSTSKNPFKNEINSIRDSINTKIDSTSIELITPSVCFKSENCSPILTNNNI